MDYKYPSSEPVLVTCGLPYANGPMHIAHLRTYVPADIFVRVLRKLGQEVVFISGSDTHGTPITLKAEEEGVEPEEIVKRYHKHFQEIFPRLNINFDNYGSTDDPLNHRRTRQIAEALMENGYIYPKEVTLPYCPKCDRFLPDRYIRGICPHCGATARGDECDQGCGRFLETGELINPECTVCGTPAEYRETKHYFLKLTSFEAFLRSYLKDLDGTDIARNYAIKWLDSGLKDWNITRNLKWGVKFPAEEELVLYVWFDAPIGYISSTEEWSQRTGGDWLYYWTGPGKLVHFIGGDIIYHHCLFWPSMLHGSDYSVPDVVVASGMVRVQGHVFSKSRGYVIWVEDDYLVNELDPDALRYYIASYTGHTRDLDFSWDTYGKKLNNELVAKLGNFLYRATLFAHRNYGAVPEGEVEREIYAEVENTIEAFRRAIDEYKFKMISDAVLALSSYANRYIQSREPWKLIKTDPKSAALVIYNSLWLAKALAVLMDPIMPGKAEMLWKQLGYNTKGGSTSIHDVLIDEALTPLKADQEVAEPDKLFKQIPEEEVEALTEAMLRRIAQA
ncbi:MAG: methionine--tRNA ligase [Candidatus Bathyarchaeia archaeon]